MLTKYDECKAIRWKGWIAVFAALSIVSALFTWDGWISILPVVGTVSGTIGCWTNNAGKIRAVNLCVNSPGMMLYDVLVGSWGGVLNEGMTMLSIIISIARQEILYLMIYCFHIIIARFTDSPADRCYNK